MPALSRLVIWTLILSCLMIFTGACAKPQAPEFRVACAPMEYFSDVKKFVPPKTGLSDFLIYADALSVSWDNLYLDRLRARKIMEETLEKAGGD